MPTAPQLILDLVERFTLNKDHYLSTSYNEEQLRNEFLNPIFQLLGWDMANAQGKSDAYKEVLYEESIKAGSPDFTFRIGNQRKFFVEAKAPRVNIATEWQSAVQIRSYARSAGLSLSILTNFAQFAVYDGRIPISSKIPKASEALVFPIIPYTELPNRWHEIESIFSNKSVWSGLFDRFAESKTDRRRTFPIGDEFLDQISRWREQLAWHLRRDNPNLNSQELNFSVQMTIDRIIFLRICEDRGIEPFGQLQRLININNVYGELCHLFTDADAKYNSGLFHFRKEAGRKSEPDQITADLEIKDSVLKPIIKDLYESHYKFDVVPTEILGQVYEQFLGKVIVLKDKTATVEDKPEVRKAGGVYYTPAYIVQHIVTSSLDKLLENRTPQEVEKITVLDPACGSGSFLLGAYQKLLDWHLDYYYQHNPEGLLRKNTPPIRQVVTTAASNLFEAKPSYRLTISERKRILLNNIYGVDIDAQAVEVTKLSLLLKCLEGETSESVQSQLKFMRQRALPDLNENIKCGNSLISHDIYAPAYFKDQEPSGDDQIRINAFDWNIEFKSIMKSGGFDAIIGNPPYGASLTERETAYLRGKLPNSGAEADTYAMFMEKSVDLSHPNGQISMIVPTAWYSAVRSKKIRRFIATTCDPRSFVNLPYDVFADAWVDTTIFILVKRKNPTNWPRKETCLVQLKTFPKRHAIQNANEFFAGTSTAEFSSWFDESRDEFLNYADTGSSALMQKMQRFGVPLVTQAEIQRGVTPFKLSPKPVHKNSKSAFKGTVRRYKFDGGSKAYVRYDDSLAEFKPERFFTGPRLLLRELISRKFELQAVRVETSFVTNKSMQSIRPRTDGPDLSYLLGIINSKLLSWYFLKLSNVAQRDDFPKIVLKETRNLPMPQLDLKNKNSKSKHDALVKVVDTMLLLHQQLAKAKVGREQIQRKIDATDKQIDSLVYELYQLTSEEIQLVENATTS